MQTFLPYPSMHDSLACLDDLRLNKQITESEQIIKALTEGSKWENHPAVLAWEGYPTSLMRYHDVGLEIWERRGRGGVRQPYNRTIHRELPWWWGFEPFHDSHKANLLRKAPSFYKSKRDFNVDPDMFYLWPSTSERDYVVFRLIVPDWARGNLEVIQKNRDYYIDIAFSVVASQEKKIPFRDDFGKKFFVPSSFNVIFKRAYTKVICYKPIKMM